MFFPNQDTFARFLSSIAAAHQRELVALARRADTLSSAAPLGGAWTLTPGTDALAALHPELHAQIPRLGPQTHNEIVTPTTAAVTAAVPAAPPIAVDDTLDTAATTASPR